MAKIIVVTSGKGGVGKTTTSANIAAGLALKGFKTCVIDFDVGLRNLDLIMGAEKRVVFDFVNVIKNEAKLKQALIKDKNVENLYLLPASQTRDKDSLTKDGVERVLNELKEQGFEYIICDSPAGIENGAFMAMYFADEALIVTNPEVSSINDSDRMIGIINAKSKRAENGMDMTMGLVINRFDVERAIEGDMIDVDSIINILSIPLKGVIVESPDVLQASNNGTPVILNAKSKAAHTYSDLVERMLGKDNVPYRYIEAKKGIFAFIFEKWRK